MAFIDVNVVNVVLPTGEPGTTGALVYTRTYI
jgi:hypothetical protein